MPGHAGNFLARLFSLGEEVMPQLPKNLLDSSIKYKSKPPLDRLTLYSFSNVLKSYPGWQEFHRDWTDYESNVKFLLLNTILAGQYSHVIYSIHPHEFTKFENEIEQYAASGVEYFYVTLDSKYQSWVDKNQEKLKFKHRPFESERFDQLRKQYNMKQINLTAMLDSEELYKQEYIRCCDIMKIIPHPKLALKLYEDWKSVRA